MVSFAVNGPHLLCGGVTFALEDDAVAGLLQAKIQAANAGE